MILREVDVLHKADLSQIFLEFIERLPRQVIPSSGSLLCLLQECLGVSLVPNLKRHSSRVPHKPPVDTIVRLDEGPVIGLLVSRSPSWSLLPPELL